MGQVPPRRRIGGRGLSRLDRHLRRRAGHPGRRRWRATYIGIRTLQAADRRSRAKTSSSRRPRWRSPATATRAARPRSSTSFRPRMCWRRPNPTIPQLTAQLAAERGCARRPARRDAGLARWRVLTHSQGIPAPPRNVAVGIPADLLRRRPDVRAAELKAEAQSARSASPTPISIPAFSLGGRAWDAGLDHQRQQAQRAVHLAEHHLRRSARRSAGRSSTTARSPTSARQDAELQALADRLQEHGAEGAARGRERTCRIRAGRQAGRLS